jgi:nucleoside-diphosphate-sugar epimerase
VTTVRSTEKADKIKGLFPSTPKSKLDFAIVEDVAKEDAFDEAIKSDPPFEAVIHTASPFHFNVTDVQKELLDPAVIGTTGVLQSIKKSAPTVKQVVITSSFASILDPKKGLNPGYVYSEKDWNPMTHEEALKDPSSGYRASKTFAEKAAWDFVEKEKPNFTLTTMCPPLVLGPIIPSLQSLSSLNTSNQRILKIINGDSKEKLPPTGTYLWVDVRDLALAHVKAIELPAAANKRFFVTAGHFTNEEIMEDARTAFPSLKDKLPAKGTPGGGNPEGGLASIYKYDNSRVIEVLRITFRTLSETVTDAVNSLLEAGA